MLAQVAEELNVVLGLEPKIATTHNEVNLRYLVTKAATLVKETDTFTADVAEFITNLPNTPDSVCIKDSNETDVVEPVVETTVVEVIDTKETQLETETETAPDTSAVKKRAPHIIRIGELIAEGLYSSKEIVNIIVTEFPDKREDTVTTYVRSTRNPKYNAFDSAVIEVNGIFKFEE